MSVKHLIARGVGFAPGSPGVIVTHGLVAGPALGLASPGYVLSTLNAAAARARVVRPLLFCALDFASQTMRLTTAPFDIAWGGHSYSGIGHLGGIEAVEEGVELQAYRLRMTLNGIPLALISIALGEAYQGRSATLFLGFLDEGHRLIDSPDTIFRGRMDRMIVTAGETGSIGLDVESRLADWERPRIRRFNDADQQQRYPDDKGLAFAEQMAAREIVWPAASFFR